MFYRYGILPYMAKVFQKAGYKLITDAECLGQHTIEKVFFTIWNFSCLYAQTATFNNGADNTVTMNDMMNDIQRGATGDGREWKCGPKCIKKHVLSHWVSFS